jgi:hypothetical protein
MNSRNCPYFREAGLLPVPEFSVAGNVKGAVSATTEKLLSVLGPHVLGCAGGWISSLYWLVALRDLCGKAVGRTKAGGPGKKTKIMRECSCAPDGLYLGLMPYAEDLETPDSRVGWDLEWRWLL